MFFSELNFLTIAIAGVSNMILGYVWYMALFAKPWMKLVNLKEEKVDEQASPGMTYITSFVLALVSATVFQSVFFTYNPASMMEAVSLGFFVWLGFIFCVMTNQSLFVKKPFKLILIDSGFYLASIIMWSLLFLYVG